MATLRCCVIVALLGLALLVPGPAEAVLVTNPALIGPGLVIDFSQFGPGYGFTFGATEVGGLVGYSTTFTAAPGGGGNSGQGSVLGNGTYGLDTNGFWSTGPGGNAYAGLDSETGSMRFTFNASPVSAVGGFVNYLPGLPNPTIRVLGLDLVTVLETYDLSVFAPISTPGGANAGAFRGIVRSQADIGAFELANAYIVVDDLTFAPVPEPGTLLLLGSGLSALVLRRRRSA